MSDAIVQRYNKILADTTFSDLHVKMGKDQVVAHRAVVSVRCEDLCAIPDPTDKKKKIKSSTTIQMKNVSNAAIFQRVLECIYTGTVNFTSMTSANIMELNKAAKNLNLKRLSFLCEDFLSSNLNVDNIFETLAAAHKLNEAQVKSVCKFFAIEHFNEIVTNNAGLHILGIDLFQEIVTAYLTFQATKSLSKPQPTAPPPNTLLDDYKRLYNIMPYADTRFVVDGEEIPCHKAILAGASEKFKVLFKDSPTSVPLTGVSVAAFKSMLRFVYYGDDEIEPLPCCELVGFCRKYELNDLLTICENKIRNSIDVTTVLGILEVAYQPEMAAKQALAQELKDKTFPFVVDHFNEIDLERLRRMNLQISVDLVFYIQEHQKKRQKGR